MTRLKGPFHTAHLVQLVKLIGGVYTVEHGSHGVICDMLFMPDEVTPSAVWVSWCGPPDSKGGISGPIDPDDLEVLGTVYVHCKD